MNEYGPYITHIYAYDAAGNSVSGEADYVTLTDVTGTQTIPDGDYYIQTMCSTSPTVLTVDANSSADGANIHIWETDFPKEHIFRVEYKGNGYYEIYNTYAGGSLDVASASLDLNTNLRAGLYLDLENSKTADGSNIWAWTMNQCQNQKWKFEPCPVTVTKKESSGYTTKLYNLAATTHYIIAQYQNGVLLSTTTKTATDTEATFTAVSGADEIKIMVWDSVKGLIPLTEVEKIDIN